MSVLFFRGTSQRGHTGRVQECGAIFRLFVLMLCHRPVHTQTHILSCSALTLSPVSNTAEVRGKLFHYLQQALTVLTPNTTVFTIPQITLLPNYSSSLFAHVCFCESSVCVCTGSKCSIDCKGEPFIELIVYFVTKSH